MDSPDLIEQVPRRRPTPKPRPLTPPPALDLDPMAPTASNRNAEIDALQDRISKLESLLARDEEVLRKLLALLVEKGVATREEILERIR
jgi:hypothetical protein